MLSIDHDEVHIEAVPLDDKQICPCCGSDQDVIRIADRFHVHGYVIESVQEVRKTVQHSLSPRAKAHLKANHRLLNPPSESLSEESRKKLDTILNYSPLLRSVWEWKEAFTTWYDCSPSPKCTKDHAQLARGDRELPSMPMDKRDRRRPP